MPGINNQLEDNKGYLAENQGYLDANTGYTTLNEQHPEEALEEYTIMDPNTGELTTIVVQESVDDYTGILDSLEAQREDLLGAQAGLLNQQGELQGWKADLEDSETEVRDNLQIKRDSLEETLNAYDRTVIEHARQERILGDLRDVERRQILGANWEVTAKLRVKKVAQAIATAMDKSEAIRQEDIKLRENLYEEYIEIQAFEGLTRIIEMQIAKRTMLGEEGARRALGSRDRNAIETRVTVNERDIARRIERLDALKKEIERRKLTGFRKQGYLVKRGLVELTDEEKNEVDTAFIDENMAPEVYDAFMSGFIEIDSSNWPEVKRKLLDARSAWVDLHEDTWWGQLLTNPMLSATISNKELKPYYMARILGFGWYRGRWADVMGMQLDLNGKRDLTAAEVQKLENAFDGFLSAASQFLNAKNSASAAAQVAREAAGRKESLWKTAQETDMLQIKAEYDTEAEALGAEISATKEARLAMMRALVRLEGIGVNPEDIEKALLKASEDTQADRRVKKDFKKIESRKQRVLERAGEAEEGIVLPGVPWEKPYAKIDISPIEFNTDATNLLNTILGEGAYNEQDLKDTAGFLAYMVNVRGENTQSMHVITEGMIQFASELKEPFAEMGANDGIAINKLLPESDERFPSAYDPTKTISFGRYLGLLYYLEANAHYLVVTKETTNLDEARKLSGGEASRIIEALKSRENGMRDERYLKEKEARNDQAGFTETRDWWNDMILWGNPIMENALGKDLSVNPANSRHRVLNSMPGTYSRLHLYDMPGEIVSSIFNGAFPVYLEQTKKLLENLPEEKSNYVKFLEKRRDRLQSILTAALGNKPLSENDRAYTQELLLKNIRLSRSDVENILKDNAKLTEEITAVISWTVSQINAQREADKDALPVNKTLSLMSVAISYARAENTTPENMNETLLREAGAINVIYEKASALSKIPNAPQNIDLYKTVFSTYNDAEARETLVNVIKADQEKTSEVWEAAVSPDGTFTFDKLFSYEYDEKGRLKKTTYERTGYTSTASEWDKENCPTLEEIRTPTNSLYGIFRNTSFYENNKPKTVEEVDADDNIIKHIETFESGRPHRVTEGKIVYSYDDTEYGEIDKVTGKHIGRVIEMITLDNQHIADIGYRVEEGYDESLIYTSYTKDRAVLEKTGLEADVLGRIFVAKKSSPKFAIEEVKGVNVKDGKVEGEKEIINYFRRVGDYIYVVKKDAPISAKATYYGRHITNKALEVKGEGTWDGESLSIDSIEEYYVSSIITADKYKDNFEVKAYKSQEDMKTNKIDRISYKLGINTKERAVITAIVKDNQALGKETNEDLLNALFNAQVINDLTEEDITLVINRGARFAEIINNYHAIDLDDKDSLSDFIWWTAKVIKGTVPNAEYKGDMNALHGAMIRVSRWDEVRETIDFVLKYDKKGKEEDLTLGNIYRLIYSTAKTMIEGEMSEEEAKELLKQQLDMARSSYFIITGEKPENYKPLTEEEKGTLDALLDKRTVGGLFSILAISAFMAYLARKRRQRSRQAMPRAPAVRPAAEPAPEPEPTEEREAPSIQQRFFEEQITRSAQNLLSLKERVEGVLKNAIGIKEEKHTIKQWFQGLYKNPIYSYSRNNEQTIAQSIIESCRDIRRALDSAEEVNAKLVNITNEERKTLENDLVRLSELLDFKSEDSISSIQNMFNLRTREDGKVKDADDRGSDKNNLLSVLNETKTILEKVDNVLRANNVPEYRINNDYTLRELISTLEESIQNESPLGVEILAFDARNMKPIGVLAKIANQIFFATAGSEIIENLPVQQSFGPPGHYLSKRLMHKDLRTAIDIAEKEAQAVVNGAHISQLEAMLDSKSKDSLVKRIKAFKRNSARKNREDALDALSALSNLAASVLQSPQSEQLSEDKIKRVISVIESREGSHRDLLLTALNGEPIDISRTEEGQRKTEKRRFNIKIIHSESDLGFYRDPDNKTRPVYEFVTFEEQDDVLIANINITYQFLLEASDHMLAQNIIHPILELGAELNHSDAVQEERIYNSEETRENPISDLNYFILEHAIRDKDIQYLTSLLKPHPRDIGGHFRNSVLQMLLSAKEFDGIKAYADYLATYTTPMHERKLQELQERSEQLRILTENNIELRKTNSKLRNIRKAQKRLQERVVGHPGNRRLEQRLRSTIIKRRALQDSKKDILKKIRNSSDKLENYLKDMNVELRDLSYADKIEVFKRLKKDTNAQTKALVDNIYEFRKKHIEFILNRLSQVAEKTEMDENIEKSAHIALGRLSRRRMQATIKTAVVSALLLSLTGCSAFAASNLTGLLPLLALLVILIGTPLIVGSIILKEHIIKRDNEIRTKEEIRGNLEKALELLEELKERADDANLLKRMAEYIEKADNPEIRRFISSTMTLIEEVFKEYRPRFDALFYRDDLFAIFAPYVKKKHSSSYAFRLLGKISVSPYDNRWTKLFSIEEAENIRGNTNRYHMDIIEKFGGKEYNYWELPNQQYIEWVEKRITLQGGTPFSTSAKEEIANLFTDMKGKKMRLDYAKRIAIPALMLASIENPDRLQESIHVARNLVNSGIQCCDAMELAFTAVIRETKDNRKLFHNAMSNVLYAEEAWNKRN
ncbi:MAG: hypothetical protein HQ579_02740, partial [Candidatus Omnitrophica bacterium]|nr:hypothetical protein [Candidatus Omnitrophota bacterium]